MPEEHRYLAIVRHLPVKSMRGSFRSPFASRGRRTELEAAGYGVNARFWSLCVLAPGGKRTVD